MHAGRARQINGMEVDPDSRQAPTLCPWLLLLCVLLTSLGQEAAAHAGGPQRPLVCWPILCVRICQY